MYIVYAMTREQEWHGGNSYIGQTYILKSYKKASQLLEILQSIEKDREITWEILDTYDSESIINDDDEIGLNDNNKLIIKPAKN